MPKEQLILRMLSMLGRVELNHLRSGNMDDEDWARVSSAVGMALGDGGMDTLGERLIIDDCSQQTPSSLRASARRYTRLYGKPALIMVDYLQLIRAPELENRTQEIAEISRSLKALGKELGCPVLALSQLNRQVEQRADKRPNNGDLRDSGALEQDADLIMFIYRDEVYNPDSLAKGRLKSLSASSVRGPQARCGSGSTVVTHCLRPLKMTDREDMRDGTQTTESRGCHYAARSSGQCCR